MSKIMNRLEKQEQIEGLTNDLKIVKTLYSLILKTDRSARTFDALTKIKHYRYGKLSYETHIFYYPSELLMELLKCDAGLFRK